MPADSSPEDAYGAKTPSRRNERGISELAARQHGVVSARQLLAQGFGRRAIGRRLDAGRLHAMHSGVFAVGHPLLSARGRWMAAVLACGPGAVLCRRSAGVLWDLRAYSGLHEVAALGRRRRAGVRACEFALWPDETTVEDGIPVTTVARTLLDLAAVLDRHRLGHAVATAEKRLLADSPSLPVLIERHRGARGMAALRAVVADRRLGLDVPASELEVEFGAFLAERGLPAPERNVWMRIGGADYELDCLWRRERLVVELDSRAHHSDALAFERDRARDAALLAAGLRTVRVTARRIRADGDLLERQLWAALLTGSTAS